MGAVEHVQAVAVMATPTVTPMAMVMVMEPAAAVPTGAAAPWTLTASDGSGLELVRVDAKAVAEGPLAFTELHLTFHNPENRIREGTFTIQRFDGTKFAFDDRPFVIMTDHAFVDLGRYRSS